MNSTRLLMSAFAAIIILAVIAPTSAEPADRILTLEECIHHALEHHNSILASEKDLAGSQANVARARAGYMPRITVGHSYYRSGYEGDQIGSGLRRTGNFTDHQTEIGLRQTLYDGGRTRTAISQASATRTAVDADLERTIQERILAVTISYFDVLRSKRLADIAAQSVAEAEEQRELIQARIDEGDAARVDIYPVEVQLANARLQKLQADNNARVAMSGLRNSMGLTGSANFRLADVEEPSWGILTLDECTEHAMNLRPELIRAAAQVDSAQAGLSLARLQRIPVPTAGISYDRGLGGTGYDSQWSVGMGLSMNVFDGGAAAADERAARSALQAWELRSDQMMKDITTEIEEAYLNLQSSLERLEASKSNVALARTNLEVAGEKYRQGLAIPLEVVSAQVSHADAQAGHAQALYDSYISRARLDKAMGRREY